MLRWMGGLRGWAEGVGTGTLMENVCTMVLDYSFDVSNA